MSSKPHNVWLSRFTVFTAVSTLLLICVGGLVTSHGVGMAVPDWPNTYGYNMFFFPFSQWVGGIFYEHSHRLVGSFVGLLTTILVLWLYGRKSRPLLKWSGLVFLVAGLAICFAMRHKWQDGVFLTAVGAAGLGFSFFWPNCEPAEKWIRRLGIIAFISVVFQGVLGGLRVTAMKDELGIFHGTFAQMFFVLMAAIALFHSKFWRNLKWTDNNPAATRLLYFYLAATALILVQLALGATMRHQHAGLAIPDFPLAYGRVWPDMSADAVAKYNQDRVETVAYNSITGFQIGLQMTHRIVAGLIFIAVIACAVLTKRRYGWQNPLARISLGWMALIFVQVFLGAATIWTNKSADIATAHVAVGALSLVTGALLVIITRRCCVRSQSAVSTATTDALLVGQARASSN